MTKFEELLKKYTKEYENFLKMGLSEDDAITLIRKHVREDTRIKTASPYSLINLLAGEDVFSEVFTSFDTELSELKKEVLKLIGREEKEKVSSKTLEQCVAPLVEKEEEKKPCACVKKEVIADTPKHKEFRVTYPNGYYKYKMLVK
jgi:hypothetical protein